MGERNWRPLKLLTHKIPGRPGCGWTPVFDYLTPGKMYRLQVPVQGTTGDDQKWEPESAGECTADGNPATARGTALLLASAAVGALVAKIGGSTADLTADKDKVVLFAVGRHCVFTVDAAKGGTLYLGVNDSAGSMFNVNGQLTVELCEAL
jgi:hypothetical protein